MNIYEEAGLTNDQIGEISGVEGSMNALIDTYIRNLRIKAFNMEITPEEYAKVQVSINTLEYFRTFMHELPIKKLEYEREEILKEAEKKAHEEAEKLR